MRELMHVIRVCLAGAIGAALACAGPRVIQSFPKGSGDLAEVGMAVLADTPTLAEFADAVARELRPTTDTLRLARVLPHTAAHKGKLREGKVLARLTVNHDDDVLGLKAGVSNWWVLQKRKDEWISVIVSASGSIKELPLAIQRQSRTHNSPEAGWLPRSGAAWVACEPKLRCCSDTICEEPPLLD